MPAEMTGNNDHIMGWPLTSAEEFLGEKKMDKFVVKTISPEISALIQKKAFELGYEWDTIGAKVKYTEFPYLVFYTGRKRIYWSCDIAIEGCNVLSLDEFFALSEEKSVKVGDIEVKRDGDQLHFEAEGRVVKLSREKAKEIYDLARGSGLPDIFAIYTVCPEISEVIQKKLFQIGCEWGTNGETVQHTRFKYLYTNMIHKTITWSNSNSGRYKEITLEDLFTSKRINVGPYEVVKTDTGIKIGCTDVPMDKVEEAYQLLGE